MTEPVVYFFAGLDALSITDNSEVSLFLLRLDRRVCNFFLERLALSQAMWREHKVGALVDWQDDFPLLGLKPADAGTFFNFDEWEDTDAQDVYDSLEGGLISAEHAEVLLTAARDEDYRIRWIHRTDDDGNASTDCRGQSGEARASLPPIPPEYFQAALDRIVELEGR